MSQTERRKIPRFPSTVRGIFLRSSVVDMAPDFNPLNPGQKLGGSLQVLGQRLASAISEDGTESLVAYRTTFKFSYSLLPNAENEAAPEKEPQVATIEAEFQAEYSGVPDGFTHEEQQQFGAFSVMAQLWPYWREYLHGCLGRMGLPQTVLPPLFVNQHTNTVKIGDHQLASGDAASG